MMINHEANAMLLYDLYRALGASGFGAIAGFFETDTAWRCPCCLRSKREIARLDKNGALLCPIVLHHDHFSDCVPAVVRDALKGDWAAYRALMQSVVRFDDVLICGDCNVAEPAAKGIVGAPKPFSFAPFEIAGFIAVTPHAPHTVNPERARIAYKAASQSMAFIAERLREIGAALKAPDSDWENAGAPALRVLKALKPTC